MEDFFLFEKDTVIKIIFWSVTILITGFIAQFGKKFATYLINRLKKNNGEIPGDSVKADKPGIKPVETISIGKSNIEKNKEKIQKKIEKARLKRIKKEKND